MNEQNGAAGEQNQSEINELRKELDRDKEVRDQAQEIVQEEDGAIRGIEKKIHELEHPRFEIFVNSEKKKWDKPEISFREVVILFYGVYEDSETVTYSVDYSHGPVGHEKGILDPGQSVPVINKMRFRVQKANRS